MRSGTVPGGREINLMTYVDGFMAAVPETSKQAYIDHAKMAAGLFKEYGALSVVECWGVDVPEGKKNSMNTAVLREDGEGVVFSWVTWPSKDVRDEAWGKIESDTRMQGMEMPLDGSRLIFGGFEMILEV
jgi:uncharacterized protein YbaA (DUF1428 family)